MYEPYFRMSTLRLPMVMAIATREMTSPETVWSGQQDAVSVRDAGWIQVYVENNQEILDMIIQGYKIAEHPDVLLPVNVCYDGFYLSHLTERVEIPHQPAVDDSGNACDPGLIQQDVVIDILQISRHSFAGVEGTEIVQPVLGAGCGDHFFHRQF